MADKKFKVSLFDIIVVVLCLAVGIGLYLFTHKDKVAETRKITYSIELNDLPVGLTAKIKEGDKLTDGVKNYGIGTVKSATAVPNTKLNSNLETNTVVERPVPNTERAIIEIEANVIESASDFRVEGSFLVKVGLPVDIHGPSYAGSGYIISMER